MIDPTISLQKSEPLHSENSFPEQLWHQQSSESPEAYQALQVHLETQSLRTISAKRKGNDPATPQKYADGIVAKWSRKHDWVERERAWREFLARDGLVTRLETIHAINAEHAAAALKMRERGLEALKQLDPLSLKPSEVLEFLDTAIKIEREALELDYLLELELVERRRAERRASGIGAFDDRALTQEEEDALHQASVEYAVKLAAIECRALSDD